MPDPSAYEEAEEEGRRERPATGKRFFGYFRGKI
jgi:hypothetical protein